MIQNNSSKNGISEKNPSEESHNEWLRYLEGEDFEVPLAVGRSKKRMAPIRVSEKQQRAIRRQSDGR